VDYIKAYLPKDTLDGKHKNREVAFSYTVGDCSLSVPETQDIALLKIQPNPAQERFLVQYPSHWQRAKFSLLNAQGRLILETFNPEVDIRHLPAGMYYLMAEHNHEKLTQKLMIQHP
jgi:hypothetical protein